MLTNKTLRILSLDGGGTRGFLQAHFLKRFCERLNINKVSDCFDIIAGTSVGGINAVAFADGIVPDTMCAFFREKAPWIFTIRSLLDMGGNNASVPSNKPNNAQKLYMLGTSDPFYKAVSVESNYGDIRLKQEITNIFGDRLFETISTPTIVTAHNYQKQYPMVFTNVSISGVPETFKRQKITDVLMSTSAAPIYFPSYRVRISADLEEEEDSLIDGGLFQNNPTTLALTAGLSLFPSSKRICILSIGTGLSQIRTQDLFEGESPSEQALLKYLNLLDISMTNAEHANDLCLKTLSTLGFDSNIFYYRFNFNLDPERDCALDTSTTEFFDYLEEETNKKILADEYEIGHFASRLCDIDGDENTNSAETPGN